MCFSATASLTAGAVLVPTGLYCIGKSLRHNHKYLLLSFLPLFFGIQQLFEAMLWKGHELGNPEWVSFFSLGYMFFAWLVWPTWIPLSTFPLEPCKRKYLFVAFSSIGGMLGGIQYIPYFAHDGWLVTEITGNAISYQGTILFDMIMRREITNTLYLIVILTPLLASSDKELRIFGGLLVISILITYFFFSYAYISAFCFGAAAMSFYLMYIIIHNANNKKELC